MRFNTIALSVLALATTGVAHEDYMHVLTRCHPMNGACSSIGLWRTGFGWHPLSADDGCRDNQEIPNLLCMDWAAARGHFYFTGQNKRCLKRFSRVDIGACRNDISRADYNCDISLWIEVPCTW
jgi:hypothetical protein